jgi:hypothetical protein
MRGSARQAALESAAQGAGATSGTAAVRVEDDRREDDRARPRSGAIVGVAQREVAESGSEGSYEARHGAQRRTGP